MDAAIAGACSGYATEARAAEIEAFFADKCPRNARKIAQICEATRAAARYVDAVVASDAALAWLNKTNAAH